MLLKKRKRHKIKRLRNRKKLFLPFLFVFLTLVLSVGSLLLFPKFYKEKFHIISPIARRGLNSEKQLENELKKKDIAFLNILQLPDSSYKVMLSNGAEVIVTPNKDILQQISSLQLILARLTIEGKKFSKLDFRFDKPVLSY